MSGLVPPGPPDFSIFPRLDPSWPAAGLGDVAVIAAQLPEPEELPPGSLIVVHPTAAPSGGRLSRLFSREPRRAHVAVRCTALLARGFTRIGAGVDAATREELVWGYTASS
jgi:hypothetical protein